MQKNAKKIAINWRDSMDAGPKNFPTCVVKSDTISCGRSEKTGRYDCYHFRFTDKPLLSISKMMGGIANQFVDAQCLDDSCNVDKKQKSMRIDARGATKCTDDASIGVIICERSDDCRL